MNASVNAPKNNAGPLNFLFKSKNSKNVSKNNSVKNSSNSLNSLNATRKNSPMMGGAKRVPRVGTRAQVWHGTAHHTSGGLTRNDLKKNKHGRIVSRRASSAGKKALKHLVKAGYKAKKGTFKLFH